MTKVVNVEEQMGSVVFEGLGEPADEPVRMGHLMGHLGAGVVARGREKGSEREVGGLPRINLKRFRDLTQVLRKGQSLPGVE